MPGVFVAGDVRKGSVKRLTAAVGEGAMAIQFIHQYGKGKREAAGQRGSGVARQLEHVTPSG
jgi:hypothetical protein